MQWHGGKGSKERTSDYTAYNNNFDKIFEKKIGKDTLQRDVNYDECSDYDTPDLLEGDVIEWIKFDSKTVEVTIISESDRGGVVFNVPADKFNQEYKPAFL